MEEQQNEFTREEQRVEASFQRKATVGRKKIIAEDEREIEEKIIKAD
jgi:hypothetical protein